MEVLKILLKGIHHVAIICSDYERSKNFYVNVLGLKILNEVYRSDRDSYKLDLGIDDHYQIELFSFPKPPKRLSYPEATGLRHLAFAVDSVETVVKKMKQYGIAVEPIREDPITNRYFTFFKDPDGLPIEVYEV